MIEVVAPDGTIVEFPAGMPVEDMERMRAAMTRRFPPAEGAVKLDPREELQALRRLAELKPSQRWDVARIGALPSAVLTNGVLPATPGYAGLFLLMWVTRWIVAGFKLT